MKKHLLALGVSLATVAAQAAIVLPSYFTDNMIVQQNSTLLIHGKAAPGADVSIRAGWEPDAVEIRAENDGSFAASISTPVAGGPYTLSIGDTDSTVTLENVLSGEVWLCTGQSNMEFPMNGVLTVMDHEREIATAHHPDIRLLQVKKVITREPQENAVINGGGWQICSPASVTDFPAVAYFFARELSEKLRVPVGVIDVTWGGTPAEAWISAASLGALGGFEEQLDSLPRAGLYDPCYPTMPYNAMLYPLRDMQLKGILWYQGCSNVGRAEQYKSLITTLINDWRTTFGSPELPFYFVQLAGYLAPQPVQPDSEWAALREAQTAALTLGNTAMAVAADLGNPADIHPTFKQEVARRLALIALNRDYGFDCIYRAPECVDMHRDGSSMLLTFDSPVHATSAAMTGFIIAGTDGRFTTATPRQIDDCTIALSAPAIPHPTEIRYNWADYPIGNLYGPTGLPVAPFRRSL